MKQFSPIRQFAGPDLKMYHCGTERCDAGHYYGPAVRDHFLIHYIHSGKGKFRVGQKEYPLRKGQGFLICPDIITYYQADFHDPWHYSWVGFHGLKAESYLRSAGLTMENPVFTCSGDDVFGNCLDRMITAKGLQKGHEVRLLGLLYIFLSHLMEQNGMDSACDDPGSRKDAYVRKAIEYVEMNYSRKMTIAELARHIGLDRSYLGSIFKEQLNASLQHYLLQYRINKACGLLKGTDLSIGDISRSVGYDDPLLFSKLFRKNMSVPPREYRKTGFGEAGP